MFNIFSKRVTNPGSKNRIDFYEVDNTLFARVKTNLEVQEVGKTQKHGVSDVSQVIYIVFASVKTQTINEFTHVVTK